MRENLQSDLEEENLQLRNQIDEMETFLADYGLVWVGSNRSDSDSDSETSIEKTDFEFDWNKIVRNVKEEVPKLMLRLDHMIFRFLFAGIG